MGTKPKRRGRRWAVVGVIGAVAIAAVLFGAGYLDFLRPAPQTDPFLVAVIPARSGTDRVAARAIGNAIDGWADLRQIPPSRLLARLDEEEAATLGPDEAGVIAKEMGAGRFVLVRAEELGPNLNVGAELWEAADSVVRVTALDTTGSYAEFAEDWYLDVVLRLFRDQSLGSAPALRRARWIADPRAMYPYYEALAWIEVGQGDSAVAYLQGAVAIDSTFGAAWNLLEYQAWAAAYRAVAAADSAAFDSYAQIRETAAFFVSRFYTPEVSAAGLRQAWLEAETFHDSAEVQFETGQLYRNASLSLGFDPDSARPYLERALELDPEQEPGPLVYLHLFHNRLDEAFRLVEQYQIVLPAGAWAGLHTSMLPILTARDHTKRDSLLLVYENQFPGLGRLAVWRSLMWQDSMSVSRYLAESFVPGAATEDPLMMAWIELAAGRGSSLDALAGDFEPQRCQRDSESFDPAQCSRYSRYWGIIIMRASLNVPGGLGESTAVVQNLYSWIRDLYSDLRRDWVGQMVRYWYLGMLSVRLGDPESASAWVDSMSQLAADSIPDDPSSSEVRFASDLPAEVRAAIAVERGDPDAALILLEGITPSNDSPAYITRRRPYTRLARGSILLDKGRFAEADGWFATFPDFEPPNEEVAFLAPALRGRAIAQDSLGHHERALHYYRRFVTRWQDADPHLQPQVEEARQRIRELEAELN